MFLCCAESNDFAQRHLTGTPMSKLVLHIGTHKTGTTAIQKVFAANRSRLANYGIIYPDFGLQQVKRNTVGRRALSNIRDCLAQRGILLPGFEGSAAHHSLLASWVDLPVDQPSTLPVQTLLADLSRAHADSNRTVILSSEEFSRARGGCTGQGPDLRAIRKYLAGFDEIQVVCLLRHQVPFLQSLYLEVSKLIVPPDPGILINRATKSGYGVGMFMDFNLLLDRLSEAFPTDRLTFIDYERVAQGVQGVSGALLAAIGHSTVATHLRCPGDGRANVSPPPLAVLLANRISEPNIPANRRLDTTMEYLQNNFDLNRKTTIFTRDQCHQMATHFAPLNQTFETRVKALYPANTPLYRITAPDIHDLTYPEELDAALSVNLGRALDQGTQ
jgi:hypothetical protein